MNEDEFLLDDEMANRGIFSDVCSKCVHLEKPDKWKCKAFDKIPDDIWFGKNNHMESYVGDRGFRFVGVIR